MTSLSLNASASGTAAVDEVLDVGGGGRGGSGIGGEVFDGRSATAREMREIPPRKELLTRFGVFQKFSLRK